LSDQGRQPGTRPPALALDRNCFLRRWSRLPVPTTRSSQSGASACRLRRKGGSLGRRKRTRPRCHRHSHRCSTSGAERPLPTCLPAPQSAAMTRPQLPEAKVVVGGHQLIPGPLFPGEKGLHHQGRPVAPVAPGFWPCPLRWRLRHDPSRSPPGEKPDPFSTPCIPWFLKSLT